MSVHLVLPQLANVLL